MDWSNERYVRVYTRDTAEYLALCWQAKALLSLLLRKCDRAGVVVVRSVEEALKECQNVLRERFS